MARACDRCVEALDMFVAVYGAEAGNIALRTVATAGVYIGGGIAPKILPALQSGTFLDAFRAKAPMADLVATIPVAVILNPDAGLLGAAVHAQQLSTGRGASPLDTRPARRFVGALRSLGSLRYARSHSS